MIRQQPQKLPAESTYVSPTRRPTQAPTGLLSARITTSRKHRTTSHQSTSPLKYTTLIALITIFITLLLQQTFVALKNTYHTVAALSDKMTFIPADNKVQIPDCGERDHQLPYYEPPPYAPTDPSVSERGMGSQAGELREEAGFLSAEEEKARFRAQEEAYAQNAPGNGESSTQRIPQSNAVKSSTSVSLVGPLEILGPVSSSGSVTLSNGIKVNGKISSSATVNLNGNVNVDGKIDASGSIKLSRNVFVNGKLDASGSVELRDQVTVAGKVDASGGVTLGEGVKVEGKVDCSGSLVLRDGVVVDSDINTSSKIRIDGAKVCVIGGKLKGSSGCVVDGDAIIERDMKVSGSLNVNGRLHVKGDLEVHGSVTVGKGGEVIVDGKRTIHGSVQGVIGTSKS